MAYSWRHTACSLFKLLLLQFDARLFTLFCHGLIIHFFLTLNNIPLSECTTFCLPTVLVCSDVVTEYHRLRDYEQQKCIPHRVLEVGKSKIQVQADSVSVGDLFVGSYIVIFFGRRSK